MCENTHTHKKKQKRRRTTGGGSPFLYIDERETRVCPLARDFFFFVFIHIAQYVCTYLFIIFFFNRFTTKWEWLFRRPTMRTIDWLIEWLYVFLFTHTQFFLLPSTLLAWVLWCVMRAQFLHTTTQLLLLYKYYYWGLSLETRTLSYVTHVKRGLNTQLFVFTHTFCIIIWIYYTHWVGWKNWTLACPYYIHEKIANMLHTHFALYYKSYKSDTAHLKKIK